jgi:glycerol kinase
MVRTKKVFLMVDLSRTCVTVYFLSERGEMVDKERRSHACLSAKSGWMEYAPLDIVYALRSAINVGLMRLSSLEMTVAAISITGDPFAYLLWDRKSGEALTAAIDKTCPRLVSLYRSFRYDVYAVLYKEKRGKSLSKYSPLLIWEWMIKHLGISESRTVCFGDLSAWLMSQLSGLKSDLVGLSVALDMDALKDDGEWDEELLNLVSLSKATLPTINHKKLNSVTRGFVPLHDVVPIFVSHTRLENALFGANLHTVSECYLHMDTSLAHFVLKQGDYCPSKGTTFS